MLLSSMAFHTGALEQFRGFYATLNVEERVNVEKLVGLGTSICYHSPFFFLLYLLPFPFLFFIDIGFGFVIIFRAFFSFPFALI